MNIIVINLSQTLPISHIMFSIVLLLLKVTLSLLLDFTVAKLSQNYSPMAQLSSTASRNSLVSIATD